MRWHRCSWTTAGIRISQLPRAFSKTLIEAPIVRKWRVAFVVATLQSIGTCRSNCSGGSLEIRYQRSLITWRRSIWSSRNGCSTVLLRDGPRHGKGHFDSLKQVASIQTSTRATNKRFLSQKSALPEIVARRPIHNARNCELGAGEQFRRQAQR